MHRICEIPKTLLKIIAVLAVLLFHHAATAQLKADFTINKNGGCSPLTVSFTNKTTGASANATYKWDFGNGNSAAIANPGAIYKDPRTYTITLTVQDGAQSSVKTQQVTVYNDPTTDFTTSTPKFCMPASAFFTSTSSPGSGTITNWYWDFGDGVTQTTTVPTVSHGYQLAQKSTVSLTVKNNYGCYSTLQKKDIVESLPYLTVSFSADKRVLCKETESIQFTGNATGPGTLSYLWDFGDGNTSTDKNPVYTYNKAGIFTVKLTVTSSEGCVTTSPQNNYINVNSFNTDFSVPSLICSNSTAGFSNSSSPAPGSSAWEINGLPYTFGSYMSYYFNFAGNYTIRLINNYGLCKDTATKTVTIHSLPKTNGFEHTVNGVCGAPVSVTVKDTTADAVRWQWNFGWQATNGQYASTQTATASYGANSQYDIWLTVYNAAGCSTTVFKPVNIIGPTVHIQLVSTSLPGNATSSCKPITASFKPVTSDDIAEYKWEFGDGGTSTAAEPTYTWSTPGYYQVKLTYKTRQGCTGAAYFNSIAVTTTPKADFNVVGSTEICGNNPASFNSNITGQANYLTWYVDGMYAGGNTVMNYEFLSAGKHTIRLIAGYNGCYDTITRVDYVNVSPPFVQLTGMSNTCDGTRGQVTFTQTSTSTTQWVWDFGDGNKQTLTSNIGTVQHTYGSTGRYVVSLTGTAGNCSVTRYGPVTILLKQDPKLSVTATEFCRDAPIPFTLNNVQPSPVPPGPYDKDYYFVKWTYGDGSDYTGPWSYWGFNAPGMGGSLQYASAQQTQLRIIIRSYLFGCQDTSNYITYQLSGPVANLNVPGAINCYTQAVTFNDASTTLINPIKTWQWQFGDGDAETNTQSTSPVHTFASPGYYNATLRVTDSKGCTSETSKYINVMGPKAAFSASGTNVAQNSTVYFSNNTNTSGVYNTQYLWDFGDGTPTSNTYNSSHTYPVPGTYTVKLTATNPLTGCTSEATTTIVVRLFNSAFSFTKSFITGKDCAPLKVQFTNTSMNFTRVTWDFGDGITADNLMAPSHIYEKPGKYIITLYVYGPNGLTGTYTDSILLQQPQGALQANITEACAGGQITLQAAGEKVNNYAWDFGDGNIVQMADSITTHTYLHPGRYIPNILMTDANGCTAFAGPPDTITIRPNPVVKITPPQPLLCLGSSMPLQASGAQTYSWLPATGLSDANIASPLASPAATTTYTVQATDDIGCKNTGTVTVEVVHPVTVNISPNASVCAGDTVQLNASGAVLYNWINTTAGLSHTQINNPSAHPAATTTYTVTGSDAHACFTDTAEVMVQVLPRPTVNAGNDVEVWTGSPVQLTGTGSSDIIQWTWSPAQWLDCATCPSTSAMPLAETNYQLMVKGSNGCTASDNVLVKMLCAESKVAIPNAFAPNGNGRNDVFMIKGISIVKHLMIFNRWGQKVFERKNFIASDRSQCWDGTLNGQPAAEGTYVYFVEMQCATGGTFSRKGTVVLVR